MYFLWQVQLFVRNLNDVNNWKTQKTRTVIPQRITHNMFSPVNASDKTKIYRAEFLLFCHNTRINTIILENEKTSNGPAYIYIYVRS